MIEKIDEHKCTGCGICVEVCPLDTLRVDPFHKEVPPCQSSCPAMVDIRGYAHFLKNRMPWEALRILGECLPYPAITGRLCHHPCELHCARKAVEGAVNIHALERYLGDHMLKGGIENQPITHAGKVAVIGSGPAGLAAAYFFVRMGYGVTVFEGKEDIGGMLRDEVRKDRLPKDILEAQVKFMKDMGVEFRTSVLFGRDITMDRLEQNLFKTILLATGPDSKAPDGPGAVTAGTIPMDPAGRTGSKGVFACGGLVKGRAPIADIIASVKKVVGFIGKDLEQPARPSDPGRVPRPVENLPGHGILAVQRQENHSGRLSSFSHAQALAEAGRCMSCGGKAFIAHPEDCMTCFTCEMSCPSEAISVHPFKEVIPCPIQYPGGGDEHV